MTTSISRAVRLAAAATLSTLAVLSGGDASGVVQFPTQANAVGTGSLNAGPNRAT
ncbi:hypothetical protein [Actinospongicola halichondriae]|uniref:hypothetical protein n=1 Tax=Actinospongicola halichondriae TaxID=3236844 RepID=UPI003D474F7F